MTNPSAHSYVGSHVADTTPGRPKRTAVTSKGSGLAIVFTDRYDLPQSRIPSRHTARQERSFAADLRFGVG